jgi:hypothetical protein
VYGRKLDDKTLSFGHLGILYRNSFIMYDRGTKSHWVHTTGKCVQGEMKGKQLTFIPSVITSWGNWKKQHPTTKVLPGEGVQGFMGTYTLDRKPEKFGISVGKGDQANLYRIIDLKKLRVVHDQLGKRKVVVFFNADGNFATAWDNTKLDHKFKWNGSAIVDGSGVQWDIMTGNPVNKPNTRSMTPVPATAWLIERWQGFYPDFPIFDPEKNDSKQSKR